MRCTATQFVIKRNIAFPSWCCISFLCGSYQCFLQLLLSKSELYLSNHPRVSYQVAKAKVTKLQGIWSIEMHCLSLRELIVLQTPRILRYIFLIDRKYFPGVARGKIISYRFSEKWNLRVNITKHSGICFNTSTQMQIKWSYSGLFIYHLPPKSLIPEFRWNTKFFQQGCWVYTKGF